MKSGSVDRRMRTLMLRGASPGPMTTTPTARAGDLPIAAGLGLRRQRRQPSSRYGIDHRLRRNALAHGWSTSITADAQLSDTTHSYSGKGAVRYSW